MSWISRCMRAARSAPQYEPGGGAPGGGPGQSTLDGVAGGGATGTCATTGASGRPNTPRHVRNMPSRKPAPMAMNAMAITRRMSGRAETLATRPASGPVVAVDVSDLVQCSFQMAVLRSSVKRAPGADVITCGTVSAKVMVKMDATSSSVRTCCEPGEGDGCTWAAVLNEKVSVAPEVVWLADLNSPQVSDRFKPRLLPEVAFEGLRVDGCVRKAKASFSVLKGIVIRAPVSSPSVTTVTLPPGYFFCNAVLAFAMSEALKPDTDVPLLPCMSDLGNRNFSPMVTEPSALKVALVS